MTGPAPVSGGGTRERAGRVTAFLDAYAEGTSGDRSLVYVYNGHKLLLEDLRALVRAVTEVESIADERAAEALETAAAFLGDEEDQAAMYARAAALRATSQRETTGEPR